MQWFRLYHELLDDPKVQRLPADRFKQWINLLCLANQTTPRGSLPSTEDVAFRLRISETEAGDVIDYFSTADFLDQADGRLWIHGWQTRQKKSDDVTARVNQHRDKGNDTREADGICRNVTSNERETLQETTPTRSRTEKKRIEQSRVEQTPPKSPPREIAAVAAPVVDDPFSAFSAFCEELGTEPHAIPNDDVKKQCVVAKRILGKGYTVADIRGYVRYRASQGWKDEPVDMFTVEKYLPGWKLNGSPPVSQSRASPRKRTDPNEGTAEFMSLLRQQERNHA